jgi:hypothetical protein
MKIQIKTKKFNCIHGSIRRHKTRRYNIMPVPSLLCGTVSLIMKDIKRDSRQVELNFFTNVTGYKRNDHIQND